MKKHIVHNGTQMWYRDGLLHREDGPAIIWADGSQEWWQNGLRHRLDGPAVIDADGHQAWFQHGKLHRCDGPAVIWPDGGEEWRLEDNRFTKPRLTKISPTVISVFGPTDGYQEFGGTRDGLLITFLSKEDALLWYLREK